MPVIILRLQKCCHRLWNAQTSLKLISNIVGADYMHLEFNVLFVKN